MSQVGRCRPCQKLFQLFAEISVSFSSSAKRPLSSVVRSISRVSGDDYEPMNITFGDETPTVSSTSKDNAGNPVQNVVYRPSGVIVDVVAKVLGSGKVKIAIDGQISSFKATSTGVSDSPTLIKRQVKTTITASDGEVLLLGGLNDSQVFGLLLEASIPSFIVVGHI
ncbi:hypothetical protein [Janthinobacterium sp. YR213]|uniref:hypothetical protein n=1 Tax=Janthinobacterium sp. YR213 TaxID=1881027 RepID=UPI000B8712CA|nr:hypothetical protein [Janthinobacterium sp. YR213]